MSTMSTTRATPTWAQGAHPARLETQLGDGRVQCGLSPRRCILKPGQKGFCRVRENREGRLVSLNYGKGVQPTLEVIETEAVYHFAPGERILSLGNVGCMLNCDYCHNWRTSQAKFVEDRQVTYWTPREVVEHAKALGVRVLSWTYNDPVVWHEFVLDTARLAREAGLLNLYKSAFYITPEAVRELLPVIDIFSISLKSIDPEHYRKMTKGRLEPVLEATELVYRSGAHLEVSNLMVTDTTDREVDARRLATWVRERLGPEVPLHFVRFHPDYKMTDTVRTPVERLHAARAVARAEGIHNVYLGNVFDEAATSSQCGGCGARLVRRFGFETQREQLREDGSCAACGAQSSVRMLPPQPAPLAVSPATWAQLREHRWAGDLRAVHIEVLGDPTHTGVVEYGALSGGRDEPEWTRLPVPAGRPLRFLVGQQDASSPGVALRASEGLDVRFLEVFDRAHFPTFDTASGPAGGDAVPLPLYDPSRRSLRSL